MGHGRGLARISSTTSPDQARLLDFNGDGRIDLLYQDGSGSWKVAPSTGTGFGTVINTGVSTTSVMHPIPLDVDGDGRVDLAYKTSSGLYYRRNEGGSFSSTAYVLFSDPDVSIEGFSVGTVDSALRALDANGDGRADLVVKVDDCVANPMNPWEVSCTNDYYLLLGGVGAVLFADGLDPQYPLTQFRAADVNGDGLDDLLYLNNGGTWTLRRSTGKGNGTTTGLAGIPNTHADKVLIADYDGDGRDDLLRPDGNFWRVHRSSGTTLSGTVTYSLSSSSAASSATFVADISGSGHPDIVRTGSSTWQVHRRSSGLADVVTDFTDGLGRTVSVEYESLAQTAAYTLDASHTPSEAYVRRYGGPRYVVTTETHDDGVGGTRSFLHEYDTAFVSTAGRGWQSFFEHEVEDVLQGTYVLTEYDQTFPTAGMAVSVEQRTVGGKPIRLVTHVLDADALSGTTPARQFRRVEQTTTEEYEVFGAQDGALLRKIDEDPSYNTTYGHVTSVARTVTQPGVTGSWSSTTIFNRTQLTGTNEWCLGLPGLVETTNVLPGGSPSAVRKVRYAFNSADCSLDTVTEESDTDTSRQLRTKLYYDGYGNVDTVSQYSVAAPAQARTTTIVYDDDGQLPESVTIGGVSLTTELAWDYRLGVQTSVTGPDGLSTSFEHDAFGRLTKETRPAGDTDVSYHACSVCFPQHAAYFVHVEDSGGGEAYRFFDRLERPVGRDTAIRGGARSREEVRYRATGQVDQASLPYVAGEGVFWVSYDYDGIGRLIEEDAPVSETQGSGAVTTYAYLGHRLAVTDAESRTSDYVHNALGQIERVVDALAGETTYTYHPFGELHEVTDDAANVTEILYDPRGLKSDLYDPDMGHWQYDHNAFGELIWQRDAKGQEVDLSYDAAGRLDSRIETEGTTDWVYYASTAGAGLRGRLQEMTGPGGLEESYVYSSTSGALERVTRVIGSASYTFDFDFDSHGRLIEMTYPVNVHATRLGVEYAYDAWGALEQVNNAATPSLVYYAVDRQDALGRVTQATLDNGLVEKLEYSKATHRLVSIETGPAQTASLQDLAYDWDMAGNLIERFDDNLDQTDVFSYDDLDRLTNVVRDSSTLFTVTYDAIGNIKTKTGVTGTYSYGAGSAGPHAVTAIGTSMTFGYDANGNMTSRDGATIGWTSSNLPDHITHPSGDYADFTYGPDRSRWIQEAKEGTWEHTRHYAGTGFEVQTWGTGGSSRVDTHYIFANGRAVAQWTTSNVESDLLQYLHRDHQGSVVATTDDGANVVAEYEYDPFGKRTVIGGSGEDSPRGYTGHEHLAPVEMIHMNGRVQDPVIGRFLSADPFVQAPYSSQSLNRYSYVWNNPMSLVDPSGFDPEEDSSKDCRRNMTDCPPDVCLFFFSCEGLDFKEQLWLAEEYGVEQQRPAFIFDPPVLVAELGRVGSRQNEGVYWPIFVAEGTPTMGVSFYVYEQCAVGRCHGNDALPYTRVSMSPEESRDLAIQHLLLAGTMILAPETLAAKAVTVVERVAQLRAALGKSHGFGSTMAVALARDRDGILRTLVATNERNGYLRPGVTLLPYESLVPTVTRHAEQNIVNYAEAHGFELLEVGATRPICAECAMSIDKAGAQAVTPLVQ